MRRTRRFRSFVLPVALGMVFFGVPTALALLGDVNDDTLIDGTDATLVLEAVIGISPLTADQATNADVDGDGKIGIADAVMIQQLVAGEISEFPPRLPQQSGPVAITRDGSLVGVVNPDSDTVSFVETGGDTLLAEVLVGREPVGLAFTRSGDRALVTNARDASVSVIETDTFTVVNEIAVGVEPFGVVVNFAGDRAYVANMASGTVSEIDVASETVMGEATVGFQPQALAVTRDSASILVTHLKGGEVSVIDAATLGVTSVPLAESVAAARCDRLWNKPIPPPDGSRRLIRTSRR